MLCIAKISFVPSQDECLLLPGQYQYLHHYYNSSLLISAQAVDSPDNCTEDQLGMNTHDKKGIDNFNFIETANYVYNRYLNKVYTKVDSLEEQESSNNMLVEKIKIGANEILINIPRPNHG